MRWSTYLVLLNVCFFPLSAIFANTPDHLIPKHSSCDQILRKSYFTLCYNQEHRLAQWTLHPLTTDQLKKSTSRTNDYRVDPMINNPVNERDYRGTGFDRGHLVPAGDRTFKQQAMSETFYMSNMAPQAPAFNRGIWLRLENLTRTLIQKYGDAFIFTSPLLANGLPQLNKGISIPSEFSKIIFWPRLNKVLVFAIPNTGHSNKDPEDFQITLSEWETRTGLDFLWHLSDELEEFISNQKDTF